MIKLRALVPLCLVLVACHGARRDDALALEDGGFRGHALQVTLDYATRSQERAGNRVQILVNHEALEQRLRNAEQAELILAKTFIFSDDETGRRFARLLMDRARAGAYVVLQYDVKGSIRAKEDLAQMRAHASADNPLGEKDIFVEMRRAGVQVIPTNSPLRGAEADEWQSNLERLLKDPLAAADRSLQSLRIPVHIDHEKYWITGHRERDGRLSLRAILGGTNIASEYAYGGTARVDAQSGRGGWRDTDVEVRGPVTRDIALRYFDVMDYHLGRPSGGALRARWINDQDEAGSARVRFVWNQPLLDDARTVEGLYRELIRATPAGEGVSIESAYFAPGVPLRQALRDALKRGAALTVLTNSQETNDIAVLSDASRGAYAALLQVDRRAVLLERRSRPDLGEHTLHSKMASFGARGPLIIGSANVDGWSMSHNSEAVLMIDDPEARRRFDRIFAQDCAAGRAERITWEQVERSSAWDRVRQWAIANLISYFSP